MTKVTAFISALLLVVLTQISGSFADASAEQELSVHRITTESDCDAVELVGKKYMVLLEDLSNLCVTIELYAGGKMYVDDSACTEESTSVEVFSSFTEATEEGVAYFEEAGEWSGEIAFANDPSSTEAGMSVWDLDFAAKTFIGKMVVPEGCFSPSSSPSSMPSTSSIPTDIPSVVPSQSSVPPTLMHSEVPSMIPTTPPSILSHVPSSTPTAAPTISHSPSIGPTLPCVDTPLAIKFITDGMDGVHDCEWVAEEDTETRCALIGVSAACPLTCGTCTSCVDPETSEYGFKFGFIKANRGGGPDGRIYRDCGWVKSRDRNNRCELTSDICRSTCKVCTIF